MTRRPEISRRGRRGLALIELLVVMVLIAIMAGLAYPASVRGMESIRMASATDEVAVMLNGAIERAERKQTAVEITIDKPRNVIMLRSAEPNFERVLELPQGIQIDAVLPPSPSDVTGVRTVLVYPGGTAPRIGVQLINSRGVRRIISIDPITGVPRVERI